MSPLPVVSNFHFQILIDSGADPKATDNCGKSSLDYVLAHPHPNEELLSLLLDSHTKKLRSSLPSTPSSSSSTAFTFNQPIATSSTVVSTATTTATTNPTAENELAHVLNQLKEKEQEVLETKMKIAFLEDLYSCSVCHERASNCVVLECAHVVSCDLCVKQLESLGVCPICSKTISRVIKTFRS